MPKGRKIFLLIAVILLFLSFFLSSVFAVEIKILPVVQGQAYYILELGETQTFEACGFGWDENRQEEVSGREIQGIQWNFDSRFLELVEKKGATITLRAIKKRTTELSVTGIINDEEVTKAIFIVVR